MDNAQLHIRFNGRSIDVDLSDLDVGVLSTDNQIREAVATYLETPAQKLQAFAIDRNQETGHMTLRPEAVFGLNTTAVTLAKALKLKNRLAGRLKKVQETVLLYNSVLEEQRSQVPSVAAQIKERDEIMEQLISLKANIQRANNPIQELILRKGELTSKIEWLNSVSTRHGEVRHDYQNTQVTYNAVMKQSDVDGAVRQLEKEIDGLQDRIDEFNAEKKIDVDQRTFALLSGE